VLTALVDALMWEWRLGIGRLRQYHPGDSVALIALVARGPRSVGARHPIPTTGINQPAEGLADLAYDQRRIYFGPLEGLEYSSICR
jgi:hypothetical protein